MTELREIQIILVEDSPDDAELTMRSLKKGNVVNDVIWLKDGEEALNYLLRKGAYAQRELLTKPKLILLDLKLPKVSGIEVLEVIKKDDELKTIPVVIMTSSRENKDLEKCYELGVNSYVVKPINFNKFMDMANEVSMYWVMINKTPD
ncbi:MAG: response regulator [Ekhidna sp.]|uniref:response regulator n=1 Tax=Ekhidna sp. TaxID=2608089 RepID=UPI0032ED305E